MVGGQGVKGKGGAKLAGVLGPPVRLNRGVESF